MFDVYLYNELYNGSDCIMDPTLHLAEKYYGIIDPTLGYLFVSAITQESIKNPQKRR